AEIGTLVLRADEIDLDQRIRDQQPGAADGGARRRDFEVALPHRVEAMEVGEARDLHTLVTIPALPSATVTVGSGSMIGTAITKVLRGPGAALSIFVLCATPAAAQFSFPFGAPPPPNPVPAPNASPAPNAAARSQACLRLESQLAAVDR